MRPCPNCQSPLGADDRYCARCGQRVLGPEARSFRHLVRTSLEEVTDLDGRVLASLKWLLLSPGRLSRDYREGRRQRYLSPISLFLLANLVFFLVPSLSDFSLALLDQVRLQPYSGWIAPWVQSTVDAGAGWEALAAAYQARSDELAKLLVIAHVPLLALASLLLGAGRRLYYADHVVACLHFFAFLMLYYALMPYTVLPLLRGLDWLLPWELPAWSIAVSLQFLYVPAMLRTAFGYPWWRVLLATPLFLLALYGVHVVYRLLLFVLAFGSTTLAG